MPNQIIPKDGKTNIIHFDAEKQIAPHLIFKPKQQGQEESEKND
jgi:hypothetical protein